MRAVHNDIIERLRDAATAAGETIEEAPAPRPHDGDRRSWLVPIAAGVAVVAAIGAGVAVNRGGHGPDVSAPPALGETAAPRFLAQVAGTDIVIRTADRGGAVARIAGPSAGEWFVHVQAVQDNRTFYAATEARDCSARLFRFTLGEDGKVASSEALPYGPPKGMVTTSLTVSGDGSRVAYGMHSCHLASADGRIVVTDTATGRLRTWSGENPVTNLSMSADGRYVAYREAVIATVHRFDRVQGERRSEKPEARGSVPSEEARPTPEPMEPDPSDRSVVRPEEGGFEGIRPSPAVAVVPRSEAGEPVAGVSFAKAEPTPEPTGTVTVLPETITPDPVTPPIQEPYPGTVRALGGTLLTEVRPNADLVIREPLKVGAQVLRVPSTDQVRILDAAADGFDLDRSRALTLGGRDVGILLGVAISPDGRRLYAGSGQTVTEKAAGEAGGYVAEFDTARGALIRRIGPVDGGGVYLLDGDGAGERFLVRRGDEYGVVDSGGYRRLMAAGDEPRPAVAW